MHPPLQARSQQTLESILDAAEALLREKNFGDISVSEIILRAGASTGSFYARFESKDALLPALYKRYNRNLPDRLRPLEQQLREGPLTLPLFCRIIVDVFADSFEERPNLMRAMVLHARRTGTEVAVYLPERSKLHDQLVALFVPFHSQIPHPDKRAAVRAGLFFAVTSLREYLLFPDAPFATATQLSAERLKVEAAHALWAYLTMEPAA